MKLRVPFCMGALALAACSGSSTTPLSGPGISTPTPGAAGADGGAGSSGGSGGGSPGSVGPGGGGGPTPDGGVAAQQDGGSSPTGSDGGIPSATARKLGTITTTFDPAFLALAPFPASDQALVITTFSASPLGGTVGVSSVPSIGKALKSLSSATDKALVSSGMTWPNEPGPAPSSVFGAPGLIVPGGFLVPGNTTGAVQFIDATGKATKITTDKTDWFYHRVVWQDMNGDGRLDALVARATKPLTGSASGELLWLEAPASNPLGAPWTEHSLISGASAPDVFIRVTDLDHDGSPEILAPQFFSQKLVLYWLESGALKSVDVNDAIGSAFDVQFVDLNADGKLDVLATNSMTDASKGGVFAYEIPTNFKTDPWPKHVLTTGFTVPSNPLTNPAAPGSSTAFQPKVGGTGKPLIAVSGDDSGTEWLLTPSSASTSDWTYTRTDLVDTGGTCGEAAIGDVDGDGWVELFVPGYGKKTVHVFTFAP